MASVEQPKSILRNDRFVGHALQLCRELELWRAEVKQEERLSTEGFPPFERKAGIQSLVFFIALIVSIYMWRWVDSVRNPVASLALVFVMIISLPAAPLLFIFQAIGLAKARFWRALFTWRGRPKVNYPFTSLIWSLQHDSAHRERLRRFGTETLKLVLERVNQEETELRERLSSFLGNPTPVVMFGVLGGIFSGWESYRAHPESMGHSALFFGSIGTMCFGIYGLWLRVALFELTRCRGLLSLEIARRTAPNGRRRHPHGGDLNR